MVEYILQCDASRICYLLKNIQDLEKFIIQLQGHNPKVKQLPPEPLQAALGQNEGELWSQEVKRVLRVGKVAFEDGLCVTRVAGVQTKRLLFSQETLPSEDTLIL